MWKGKIVQSTVEECRDVYAIWIDHAHELLKQKNLEREETQERTVEHLERSHVKNDLSLCEALSDSKGINQVNVPLQESSNGGASVASFFRDCGETLFVF